MPRSTTVRDNLEITAEDARDFCKVGTDFDAQLNLLIPAAKTRADAYCNNLFDGESGSLYLEWTDVEDEIKLWCLQWINTVLQRGSPEISQVSVNGLGSATWLKDKEARAAEFAGLRHLKVPSGLGAP